MWRGLLGGRRAWARYCLVCLGLGAVCTAGAGGLDMTFRTVLGVPFAAMVVAVAPLYEEALKAFGLLYVRWGMRRNPRLRTWVAAGACAGLGFGLFEMFVYASAAASVAGTAAAANMIVVRLLSTVPIHTGAAALTAYGIGRCAKGARARVLLACFLAAVLLHGAFNACALALG